MFALFIPLSDSCLNMKIIISINKSNCINRILNKELETSITGKLIIVNLSLDV